MNFLRRRNGLGIFVSALFFCLAARGQDLTEIGVTQLRIFGTNLNGAGIRVGQPEAEDSITTNEWEVDPDNVSQPISLFTYYTNGGVSTTYPNSLGVDSPHADSVGQNFYDPSSGVATNVAHVDNIEANYYISNNIGNGKTLPGGVTEPVVNQSYTFGQQDANDQEILDSEFDNYSMKYPTLFISAANNSGSVSPPGTSYNCICVGAYGGSSSYGPTIDNGRCKPDITAPAGATSFSTPQVSGAAAIMTQAGWRGDGGNTNAANMIVVKALLLNGAVKPADWANVPPSPLDYYYGAGVLNVFNSYEQLVGGKNSYNFATNIPTGTAHPPVAMAASVPVLNGWDYDTNTSSATDDRVNHYFFNATNGVPGATFTLTATLVWNRHYNANYYNPINGDAEPEGINNLELFLYNAANSNLVAASTSVVDNVQQVFVPQLAQGRYDLQVWKAGGADIVSDSEPYGLAWGIYSEFLTMEQQGANVRLSWPAYPAGFAVAAATSLNPPVTWSTNGIPGPVYTNMQNVIWISPGNGDEFFRLQTPDF